MKTTVVARSLRYAAMPSPPPMNHIKVQDEENQAYSEFIIKMYYWHKTNNNNVCPSIRDNTFLTRYSKIILYRTE